MIFLWKCSAGAENTESGWIQGWNKRGTDNWAFHGESTSIADWHRRKGDWGECGGSVVKMEKVVNGHGGWAEAKYRRTPWDQQRGGELVRARGKTKCYLRDPCKSALSPQPKGKKGQAGHLLQVWVQWNTHSMCFLNISLRNSAHSWTWWRSFGVSDRISFTYIEMTEMLVGHGVLQSSSWYDLMVVWTCTLRLGWGGSLH